MAPTEDPPPLRRLQDNALVPLGRVAWELHPDGRGGVRPIIPTGRGTVEISCPACSAPLVREGTDALIRTSSFACQRCDARFAGSAAVIATRPSV